MQGDKRMKTKLEMVQKAVERRGLVYLKWDERFNCAVVKDPNSVVPFRMMEWDGENVHFPDEVFNGR